MAASGQHRTLDRVFAVSIVLKGLDGVVELIGGLALLFISPARLRDWLGDVVSFVLVGHERSPVFHWAIHLGDSWGTRTTLFAAAYLLLHGIIKVVLVWALLKQQLWAYPWMLAALGVFIVIQGYELVVHFSWWMLALTLFDVFIVALTAREWQLHRKRRAAEADVGSHT
ncbi:MULTISPECIES: DUF2127 domain-containing protein [unclassified Microbacterium]|uniref:DUF2127 domain-containing protein n=1 Tax=unclassified Microbacterium TaxID=2609290 RepID=UPI00366A192C